LQLLIYAKEKGSNSYLYRGEIPMHLAIVREAPQQGVKNCENGFQIRTTENKRVYTFCCKSEFEKIEWLKDLRKITEEITAKQDRSSQVAKQLIQSQWV
jgi:hypothetical protein